MTQRRQPARASTIRPRRKAGEEIGKERPDGAGGSIERSRLAQPLDGTGAHRPVPVAPLAWERVNDSPQKKFQGYVLTPAPLRGAYPREPETNIEPIPPISVGGYAPNRLATRSRSAA